jgi:hypothetical protein
MATAENQTIEQNTGTNVGATSVQDRPAQTPKRKIGGLSLMNMAAQNRLLHGLPSVIKPTFVPGAVQSGGSTLSFIEGKRDETLRLLQKDVEAAQLKKLKRELESDVQDNDSSSGGQKGGAKAYIVNPNAEEGSELIEAKPGQPLIIQVDKGGGAPPFQVDLSGIVTQILQKTLDGTLNKPAEAKIEPETYMIDPTATDPTQMMRKVGSGPQIIMMQPPKSAEPPKQVGFMDEINSMALNMEKFKGMGAFFRNLFGIPEPSTLPAGNANPTPMVNLMGADGKPVPFDINSAIAWVGFTNEQERKKNSAEQVTGLIKAIKENLPKFASAIERMASKPPAQQVAQRPQTAQAPRQVNNVVQNSEKTQHDVDERATGGDNSTTVATLQEPTEKQVPNVRAICGVCKATTIIPVNSKTFICAECQAENEI